MFVGRRYLRDLSHYDGEIPDLSNSNETPLSPRYSLSPDHGNSAARVLTQPLKWKGANETSKVINEKISLYEPTRYKKYLSFLKSVERVVTEDRIDVVQQGELDLFQYNQLVQQSVQYFNLYQEQQKAQRQDHHYSQQQEHLFPQKYHYHNPQNNSNWYPQQQDHHPQQNNFNLYSQQHEYQYPQRQQTPYHQDHFDQTPYHQDHFEFLQPQVQEDSCHDTPILINDASNSTVEVFDESETVVIEALPIPTHNNNLIILDYPWFNTHPSKHGCLHVFC